MLTLTIQDLAEVFDCCFQFENPAAYKDKIVATGLPASPGAAVGQVVFNANDAEEWHAQGKSAILVWQFWH